MRPERARELLAKSGAILEGHFVGTSGKHLSVYVAKDRGTRLTSVASELCRGLAEIFAKEDIDAVVAPAKGGIALSQWTAYHLSQLRPDLPEVLALYSEQKEETVWIAEKTPVTIPLPSRDTANVSEDVVLEPGEKLVIKKNYFVLDRGFGADVAVKRVLEIEDILSTGGSARKTAVAIVANRAHLVGLGVLANGGGVTPSECGVGRLEALMTVDRQIFNEQDCANHGLCARGVPINIEFGHGKVFLERGGRTS